MKLLVTGAAGFIGYHAASRFLKRGDEVLGLDDLNPYYSVALKQDRLAQLRLHRNFGFRERDVARRGLAGDIGAELFDCDAIVHLAAQAGVRYSFENPDAYVQTNVAGQVAILELAAHLPKKPPVVYASSSSVYGIGEAVPYSEAARADSPVSVYAATKRAGELLAHAYGATHGIATAGLRFFSVYGRLGRPDMAPWLFTDAILAGRPIPVFNNGNMQRDFTHVSDIVAGILGAVDRIVAQPRVTAPIYNLGNSTPVGLLDFIAAIERATGRAAIMEMKPKPPGDVEITSADISLARRDLGFDPRTGLQAGIDDFVAWFREYAGRS